MTAKLSDTFYLKRAGTYSDPLDSNDRLPIVHGDCTDGLQGIWELPCLNKTDWVYAFAGHEVLSVANGNSITIYEDDLVLGGGFYVFDEANNYEGHGTIATIDMDNPKDNAVITARGMGKPTVAAGATLMENIIDIVEDFLTVENDFAGSLFESTAKAMASSIFDSQTYAAAGCIVDDVPIWETIVNMMASFLGSVYINGEGELVLDIDINILPLGYADIIPKGDGYLKDAKIRRENIINQCPVNYAYDYVQGRFKSHTDLSTQTDAISQDLFGVRTPETPYQQYWVRNKLDCLTVQSLIVAKLKDPLYEIEIMDATLKRLEVDIGDFVVFSADSLYGQDGLALLNNFWKVLSVKPNYAKNNIVFRALQTGYFMTIAYLANGDHLANGSILAGGNKDTTIY